MTSTNKKTDAVSVQIEITSDEEWNGVVALPGLTVIDVYQEWCGPCTAMQSLLKKLKMDIDDDDMLHFAAVKAQSFDFLQQYLDNCEPTWLFYGGGEFLGCRRGSNSPMMISTIKTLMENELKIVKGEIAVRQKLDDLQ
ncbi:thioredoxin domain-containing protein 6 [Chamberlinius hualienensis]